MPDELVRPAALFADRRRVDVSRAIERQRCDLFLGRAVKHKAFARGRNAIDQPAAVGAGNQILLRIEGQNANVGFIALEEDRMLAFRRDAINFPVVAGRYIEVAGFVQSQIPDIFRPRLEIDGRTPGGIGGRFGRVFILVFSLSFAGSCILADRPLPAAPCRAACVRSCRPCHRERWPHRSRLRDQSAALAPGVPWAQK